MGHTMFGRYPIIQPQRQYVGHSAMRSMPTYSQQFTPNPSPMYRNDVIFMDQAPQAPCVHTAHPPPGTPGWPPPCNQCHNTSRVVFGMGGSHMHPAHHHHHGMMASHPMTPCVASNVPLYHQRLWYNQHRIQEMQRRRMDMMNRYENFIKCTYID